MTAPSAGRVSGTGPDATVTATAVRSLDALEARDPMLAAVLWRLVGAVAAEAERSPRFARSLGAALAPPEAANAGDDSTQARRTSRRAAGPLDPFAVHADSGENGLRERLRDLDLEQLKDIVAEHGMDHDRLAMRWKDPARVVDRIVEKVEARKNKGSAFR